MQPKLWWKCDGKQLQALFQYALSAPLPPTTKSLWLCSSVYCGPPHQSRRIWLAAEAANQKWYQLLNNIFHLHLWQTDCPKNSYIKNTGAESWQCDNIQRIPPLTCIIGEHTKKCTYCTSWCNLQTNEHNLQGIMYPIICTYHRLHINNGNKVPVFPGYICHGW